MRDLHHVHELHDRFKFVILNLLCYLSYFKFTCSDLILFFNDDS